MAIRDSSPQNANSPGGAFSFLERLGNRLPDPVLLFAFAALAVCLASAVLSRVSFSELDPRTLTRDASGHVASGQPLHVINLLSPVPAVRFLSRMVRSFTEFPPLGVVLVAMLGVGVAEHSGFIGAGLKWLLAITPQRWLSPALLLTAILSHSAADCGFVLVVPIGGLIFAAAGRHPIAGVCCAFAGVSGGYSASFLPTSLDPLLQSFTQEAARLVAPGTLVHPLCNWYFTSVSSLMIIGLAWWLTDRFIEPLLNSTMPWSPVPKEPANANNRSPSPPTNDLDLACPLTAIERRALGWGTLSVVVLMLAVAAASAPAHSPFRSPSGALTAPGSPLVDSIVPLLFLLALVPGVVFGRIAGTIRSHRDVVTGMTRSLATMSSFLVMAFAAAQFTYVFRESNLGALFAVKGASTLKALQLPVPVMIAGMVLLSTSLNLFIGSASAKWAILAPVVVPVMMSAGIQPEWTQAAFRVGSSSTNVITPLMTYFPLVVLFCRQYRDDFGIGTLIRLMIPYSLVFIAAWTGLLIAWRLAAWPLGLQ